jgi:ubiquinone/menaquinone biosynthesis C-methylase UbiE
MPTRPSSRSTVLNAANDSGGYNEIDKHDVTAFLLIARLAIGANVLDLACGHAWVASAARNIVGSTPRVVGVDSEDMLVEARKYLEHENPSGGVELICADITDLHVLTGLKPSKTFRGFDLITCFRVHIDHKQLSAALTVWAGMLAPGGRIAIDVLEPNDGPNNIVFGLPDAPPMRLGLSWPSSEDEMVSFLEGLLRDSNVL